MQGSIEIFGHFSIFLRLAVILIQRGGCENKHLTTIILRYQKSIIPPQNVFRNRLG